MITNIVTAGCSFSAGSWTWPIYLKNVCGRPIRSLGVSSSGNDYISKTLIYNLQLLLNQGINPNEILAIVMWSGIDRKSLLISPTETYNFQGLINKDKIVNPVNFHSSNSGYLIGSPGCVFNNPNITKYKQEMIRFFPSEALAIESYENWLRVQWYCESKGIHLLNLTFMDIMHYPHRDKTVLTKDYYDTVKPLYDMLDFDKWIFWKETGGLFEYTRDNNLSFNQDGEHPAPSTHDYFVRNFLISQLYEKGIALS